MRQPITLTAILVLALGTTALAKTNPPPKPYDVSAIRKRMLVYHDSKSHYFAFIPPTKKLSQFKDNFFYGDGKVFYRQDVIGASRMKDDFSCSVKDQRMLYGSDSVFEQKDGKITFTCEKRRTKLTPLSPGKASKMLDQAKFYDVYWQRVSHALARDDRGRYYFVDRLRSSDDSSTGLSGVRVFMGMRGEMKQLRMKNVVSDISGEIFITPEGRLRLILNSPNRTGKGKVFWISGEQKHELTKVPHNLSRTRTMIYRELGVYLKQRLHKPCDDL